MKGSRKDLLWAALVAVIVFGMIAPGLQAGPPQGEFKLPFDAQWGTVALPTGDYTFSVDSFTSHGTIVVYRGTQAVGFVHPQMFNGNENHGKNFELLCIRHDGKVAVRALRTDLGTFYFYLPKELKVLMAQQPQLIETVSVDVNGE